MAEDPTDLSQTIRDNAAAPAEVTVDGRSAKQHPLPEQIAADKYLASKQATRKKGLGIALKKLSPPGSE